MPFPSLSLYIGSGLQCPLLRSPASYPCTSCTSGAWTRRRRLPRPTSWFRTRMYPTSWRRRRQLVNVCTPMESTLRRSNPSSSSHRPPKRRQQQLQRHPPPRSLRHRRLGGARCRRPAARCSVGEVSATTSCAARRGKGYRICGMEGERKGLALEWRQFGAKFPISKPGHSSAPRRTQARLDFNMSLAGFYSPVLVLGRVVSPLD